MHLEIIYWYWKVRKWWDSNKSSKILRRSKFTQEIYSTRAAAAQKNLIQIVDIWDNNIFSLFLNINIGWQSWQNYCLFKCNNICQSVTGFIASDLEKEICSTVNPHSPVRQGHVNCVFRGRVLPKIVNVSEVQEKMKWIFLDIMRFSI